MPPLELPVRTIQWQKGRRADSQLLTREWIVTNGLGGYASGTVSGVATRRYHGLLIAARPAPLGRRMLLSHLSERVRLADGRQVRLSGEEHEPGDLHLYGADYLTEFRLEAGLPVWRYEIAENVIEKRIVLPHDQNTVYIIYKLVAGRGPMRLKLLPSVHNRSHDDPVGTPLPGVFCLNEKEGRYEVSVSPELPVLRMLAHGSRPAFTIERRTLPEVLYRVEEKRGYPSRGELWSPGYFRVDLTEDGEAALIASTEPWDVVQALSPREALAAEQERRRRRLLQAGPAGSHGFSAELVLAADQFLVEPVGRVEDTARVHAGGDEVRSVIAGYHWFTDWGRDTMISLEGLALVTNRHAEAGYILRTFAYSIRDGLLPNLFPEGEREGLYHTADATLWFFHAIDRYLNATGDRSTLEILHPRLVEIAEHHLRGTSFGIGVDRRDGLLRQGQAGYQLTWMDAKVGDWVVTPRRGKAVEINALWYNALRLLSGWSREVDDAARADAYAEHAERARAAFNERFWYDEGGYLFDVVDGEDGDDSSLRPNQVLSISLAHPVLDERRWPRVVQVIEERLLTPFGLRTLDPRHPDYQSRYSGDVRSRDAAYHQGTVWPWLLGPFIDAWLKVHPGEHAAAGRFLEAMEQHMNEACIGTISEVFDAEPPYHPGGCVSQAWSVAEALRAWVRTRVPAAV